MAGLIQRFFLGDAQLIRDRLRRVVRRAVIQRHRFVQHPDVCCHEVRVFSGKFRAGHTDVRRDHALLRELRAVGDHRTVFKQLAQHRIPDIRAVNIAALPCRQYILRLQVDDLHARRIHTRQLQRAQQAVVRRGRERRRDGLARQVLYPGDTRIVLYREGFRGADHVVDPEHLIRYSGGYAH